MPVSPINTIFILRKTYCCRRHYRHYTLWSDWGLSGAWGIGWDAGLGGNQVGWAALDSVSECFYSTRTFSCIFQIIKIFIQTSNLKGPYDSGFGLNMRS